MKKAIILSFFIFSFISAGAQINDDWYEVGNAAYNSELTSICFISQDTGFAVGSGGAFLKTVDGGNTWTDQNIGYNLFFNKIIFTSNTTGYIAGDSINDDWGRVLKTTNGGLTWTEVFAGNNEIHDMYFLNDTTGFVAMYGRLYKTTNGGTGWTYAEPLNCYDIFSVYFRTADSGFIAANGKAWRSDDGGNSWTDIFAGPWYQVFFTSAANGYLLKNNQFYRSTDGGSNWTPTTSTGLGGTKGGCFKNDTSGVAWSNLNSPGKIIKTDNGGISWTSVMNNPSYQITSISLRKTDSMYFACGKGGLIMKSADGINWTVLHQGNIPNKLNRMCFINDSTIYAVGDGGLILKSTNYASSWTALNSGVNNNLRGITSITPDTLFVLADNGAILKSTDAGLNWAALSTGISSSVNTKGDLLFINKYIGFALMDKIFKTTDGGANWTQVYSNLPAWEISAPSADTLFVANWGKVIKSVDTGTSWTTCLNTSGVLWGIDFISSQKGMAANSDEQVHKTTDAGANWSNNVFSGKVFEDVKYFDDSTAYLAGYDGVIYKTINSGSTWTQVVSGTVRHLYEIYFGPDGTGYMLGQDGLILRRTIAPVYSLKFDIKDDEGNALSNAGLVLNASVYPVGVDSVGGLIEGLYHYIISKNGYLSDTADVYLNSDTLIHVVLPKFHTVGFKLSNIYGSPVGMAQVGFDNQGPQATNASGETTFGNVVKTLAAALQITATGYITVNNTLGVAGDTIFDIMLDADLAAPVALAATAIGDTEFTANWQNVATADSFRLYVSGDNFVTHLPGYNGKYVNGIADMVGGLSAASGYEYRVKAVNVYGESGYSNVIAVNTTSGMEENFGNKLRVYPNPAKDYLIVESDESVEAVRLYNYAGMALQAVYKAEQGKIILQTEGLKSGFYTVIADFDGKSAAKKILISRD